MSNLPSINSSLLDIQLDWLQLIQRRESAEEESAERPVCFECDGHGKLPPERVSTCGVCDGTGRSKSPRELAIEDSDLAIAEHVSREVAKVDGYIGFVRFLETTRTAAKAEAKRQSLRAQRAESILEQVKAGAKYAMETLGRKRIDGQRGALIIKGNGGVLPLIVSDPAFVPDEYCRMEGWISAEIWDAFDAWLQTGYNRDWLPSQISLTRVTANDLIRARLAGTCEACSGTKLQCPSGPGYAPMETCEACGGTGTAAVPGAYLGPRGTHLEVK